MPSLTLSTSPSTASMTSCVSYTSATSATGESNKNDKSNESYEMDVVNSTVSACAVAPIDMKLVDLFTDQMTKKVQKALEDDKFSIKETAGLTLSICSGVQALFPTLCGESKKDLVVTVIHTIIRSLMLLGILSPEYQVALQMLPGIIDSVVYVCGGIENLWKKIIPHFLAWLRSVVWGDDPATIDQEHVQKVVDSLDVTHPSGLAGQQQSIFAPPPISPENTFIQ